MRTNRKRVPVPFLFRAADGLGADGKLIARAYGNVVEGVFTRAGQVTMPDSVNVLATVAHSVPALYTSALTLQGAATNFLLQSQTFDNASWAKTNVTVTANAVKAPDGTTTADKVEATASAVARLEQTASTISSAVVAFSCHGKIGSSATACNEFLIYNATTATTRLLVSINWTTGAVTLISGAGSYRSVEMGNGWWRIELVASAGITAGDDITCFAGFSASSETAGEYAYLWGAQLEPGLAASSYVATVASTVARIADTLYFPFTLPPQACTIFIWGSERSNPSVAHPTAAQVYLGLSDNNGDPRLLVFREATTTGYLMQHDPATLTGTAASTIGTAATVGSEVELRAVLGTDGACTLGVSVDYAAEVTNGPSTAQAIGAAWSVPRLYMGGTLAGGNPVNFSYYAVGVALGTKTRAEMRDLVEQGIF